MRVDRYNCIAYRATNRIKDSMNRDDRNYSLAVFVDYENLALGTGTRDPKGYQKRGPLPKMDLVLERLVEKGRINVKRAYCDWQRFSTAVTPLHELGIELIEIPDRAYTGKNSADIRLAVDAMEVCFTKDHLDTFVICSGDSDFSPLVAKLKEHGKRVIGVGMRQATSSLLAANCDEFIFYEDIALGAQIPEFKGLVEPEKEEAYRLLFNTIDALNRENVERPQASLVKDTIRRKRPDFSESNYGYRNFTAFLEEASRLGFIVTSFDDKSGTWRVHGFSATPPEVPRQKLSTRYERTRSERRGYRVHTPQSASRMTQEAPVKQVLALKAPEQLVNELSQSSLQSRESEFTLAPEKVAQDDKEKLESMIDRVVAAFEQQDYENNQAHTESEQPVVEEKKTAKRRGRPPKKQKLEEPQEPVLIEGVQPEMVEQVSIGQQSVEQQAAEQQPVEQTPAATATDKQESAKKESTQEKSLDKKQVQVKRRRGRPRKNPPIEQADSKPEEQSTEQQQLKPEEESEISAVELNKAGSQSFNEQGVDTQLSTEQQSPEPKKGKRKQETSEPESKPAPRRRGRPRKIKETQGEA